MTFAEMSLAWMSLLQVFALAWALLVVELSLELTLKLASRPLELGLMTSDLVSKTLEIFFSKEELQKLFF